MRGPRSDSPARALATTAPFVAWGAWCLLRGERRWEMALMALLPPALALAGPRARALLRGTIPMLLVGLLYDAMRFVRDVGVTPARVHLCDLRAVEARLFGDGERTVHDAIQARVVPALDLLAALPYGTFLYVTVGAAIWLSFAHRPAMARLAWAFLFVNLASFAVHHAWPSAPPWYFHAHGCVVDVGAAPSEGPNLARVDAMLGYPYFRGMYARSQDVFGALPSLHVGYPLLVLRAGWDHFSRGLRAAVGTYAALMAFAAVWLDHHWIVDLVAGAAFALAADVLARRLTHGPVVADDRASRGRSPRPACLDGRSVLTMAEKEVPRNG